MSRRTRWAAGAAATGVLAAGWAGVAIVGEGGPTATAETPAEPNTTAAVETDLIAETTYDATLGRLDGNTITSALEGVLTSVAAAGDSLANGAVLYTVDGEPVVGLFGDTPAFRELTAYLEPTELGAPTGGVITWLPEPGTEIGPGSVVMRIDDKPIFAVIGDVPAYRELRDLPTNMTGEDVRQLEQTLAAIGLADVHGVEVDDEFTSQTADAVEALQEYNGADGNGVLALGEFVVLDAPTTVIDLPAEVGDTVSVGGEQSPVVVLAHGARSSGPDVAQLNSALADLGYLEPADAASSGDTFTDATEAALRDYQATVGMDVDGALALGEVTFLPAAVRVSSAGLAVGAVVNPGAEVLTVTGEEIVVSVDLPAEDQGTFEVGDAVTVELPNGTDVPATVTSVATVASVSDGAPVFPIEIALDDTTAAGGLDEAPVEVSYVSESALGVTAVPVAALVALREGGYAVELVDGATTRLVGVEAGFFADGLVEVDGDIAPGDLVVVP